MENKSKLADIFEGGLVKKSSMILKNERPIRDFYKIDKKNLLGDGSFGSVRRVLHKKTGVVRACKMIDKSKISSPERLDQEIEILTKLDHPNVLKLYEYFEDKKYVYLITELCKGGELFELAIDDELITEGEASLIFRQILLAINYCHKMNIVHRDLKPENFLIEEKAKKDGGYPQLKIIDFGLSKIMKQHNTGSLEKMNSIVGTMYYMSPEVLAGSYDKSCDIWSAGCILYVLLCGYPPFNGEDDKEILKNVLKGEFKFFDKPWANISKECKDLIKKMITKPEKRLTAQECLDHKWFKIQSKKLENEPNSPFKLQKLTQLKSFSKTQKFQ